MAAAKEAWGSKRLEELDAEERLSFACEKAATEDRITLLLRAAFKVGRASLLTNSNGCECAHDPSAPELL